MDSLKKYYLLLVMSLLSSCSTYQPKTLPTQSSLPDTVPHLIIDGHNHFPALTAHPFDPTHGLDMDGVALVAVLNNPDLTMARDDASIARAQAFAAGLLPDPQLALSHDLSNTGGPGSTKAFSAGLSYDFLALLTWHANAAAEQAELKKIDLNLLWQEWQVVAQARVLYVKLTCAERLQTLLESGRDLFLQRVGNNRIAVDKKLIGNDAALPDQAALQDVQRQLNDLARQTNQNRHDLNALLGVSPLARIVLRNGAPLPQLDDAAIVEEIARLPQHRPDLLALQSGFDAQDQRYRAALIAQFPALNIGFTRARDNTGVFSNGLGVTLSLPLLNRNRGNVAIEQTTRDRLADEYQQRLDSANSDIHRLLEERRINAGQLKEIQATLGQFGRMADNADTALQKNIIDTLIVSSAHSTLLARQVEELGLQQAMLEQQVALLTLIGGALPVQPNLEQNQP